MTQTNFQDIVEARLEAIRELLVRKGAEYARGDRLSNFKRAAAAMQTTPEQACISFWMKHVVSILDMVNDLNEKGEVASREMWQEKLGDSITYLVLLEALILERISANSK